MLQPIADLPNGVLAFEATGEIHASDYRDALMPAVREEWERGEEIRIVLLFERWDGMSADAAWEDLKVGMKNITKWKRIALVTDLDRMIHRCVPLRLDDPWRTEALSGRAETWGSHGLHRTIDRVAGSR